MVNDLKLDDAGLDHAYARANGILPEAVSRGQVEEIVLAYFASAEKWPVKIRRVERKPFVIDDDAMEDDPMEDVERAIAAERGG